MNEKQNTNVQIRKARNRLFIIIMAAILGITALQIGLYVFTKTHFGLEKTIESVNCSWLSVQGACEKIEEDINSRNIVFKAGAHTYNTTYKEFGVIVNEEKLNNLLGSQEFFMREDFSFEDGISLNEEKVYEFLRTIPELQEKNTKPMANAFIKFNGTEFTIQKEVLGNKIDFAKACEITLKSLEDFEDGVVINLNDALELPNVLSTDETLVSECKKLNNVLSSTVTFKLMDGSEYTLNRDTIESWIVQEEGKNADINLQENVADFVELLSKAAKKVTTVQFKATDVGYVTMPAFEERIPKVKKQETIDFILEKLENAETYTGIPVYDEDPVTQNLSSYVEIDISRQRVFMYVNGKRIVDTPTVTGNIGEGYYTPTGVFYLNYKTYDTVLRGTNRDGSKYASPVLYWMPFYQGYGMHDANWRSKFGGDIYKTNGSHGCVNLPTDAAKTIYKNITNAMPIFIYKSAK